MKPTDIVKVMEQVDAAYPGKLKLTEATVALWKRHLGSQDYEKTVYMLDKHIARSPYPPTLHDLKEQQRPEHQKGVTRKLDEWERVASGPPQYRR